MHHDFIVMHRPPALTPLLVPGKRSNGIKLILPPKSSSPAARFTTSAQDLVPGSIMGSEERVASSSRPKKAPKSKGRDQKVRDPAARRQRVDNELRELQQRVDGFVSCAPTGLLCAHHIGPSCRGRSVFTATTLLQDPERCVNGLDRADGRSQELPLRDPYTHPVSCHTTRSSQS